MPKKFKMYKKDAINGYVYEKKFKSKNYLCDIILGSNFLSHVVMKCEGV